MDITWHDNIAGCYNQMSTFQDKMLTFQSDKMCDDQKCQDLRHCLHAAARFFQTFHTKQTFNISTDLFTHLGLIALSLPLSLMATTSDLGMTNCSPPLPTYLSLLARSSEFPPFTACSVLLLVEVPTDSQVLVDVPTDSRVLVDTEMPTMDPVVLIGTLPADRPGISPAGLVGRPWGSWIVTSGSFACKYILAFCQSFERF